MGAEVEEVEEVVDECGWFGFIIFLFGYFTPPVPVHTQEMLSVGIPSSDVAAYVWFVCYNDQ